ncbi:unnamed protein product [Protopolystoma xenopodis]|uniref:Uncharacterized protein n=1 Tax=Protopolystoma xenopodis TaxID=117903 RepID=A0A3S4ZMS0_9PLAT|nr:unnamed protein product [Protopolystoma xenopodis]
MAYRTDNKIRYFSLYLLKFVLIIAPHDSVTELLKLQYECIYQLISTIDGDTDYLSYFSTKFELSTRPSMACRSDSKAKANSSDLPVSDETDFCTFPLLIKVQLLVPVFAYRTNGDRSKPSFK